MLMSGRSRLLTAAIAGCVAGTLFLVGAPGVSGAVTVSSPYLPPRTTPTTVPIHIPTPTTAVPSTAASTTVKYVNGGLPIGLSYGDRLFSASPTFLGQTLDDAVQLGVGWMRVDLAWDDIQHDSPAVYNWAPFDRIVQAASARHLKVLPILAYTPAWARAAGCTNDKCSPAQAAQFAVFANAAARRYAPSGVHTWEVWNEQNTVGFWQPTPNASAYVSLLRTTSVAIRSADRTATVISGGLASTATSGGDISQLDFLKAFCAAGGPAVVDAIGYHPYSFPVLPGYKADWNAWAKIADTTTSFKSVLAGCGAGTKKLWLTEYGAPTNGPGVGATLSDYHFASAPDHVDEALQAQMATDSVTLAASSSFIGGLFWYTNKDIGTSTSTIENFFGLRRVDGSGKPAWNTLKQAIIKVRS